MTTKDITGDNAGQMTADASDTAWHLVKGATITATQYGFFEDVVFARNAYRIDGGIETTLLSGIGIQSYGDDVEVNIGRTGTISGGTGLDLRGDGAFGLGLVIHAGTDHLTLEHVSKADLHASDFIF